MIYIHQSDLWRFSHTVQRLKDFGLLTLVALVLDLILLKDLDLLQNAIQSFYLFQSY